MCGSRHIGVVYIVHTATAPQPLDHRSYHTLQWQQHHGDRHHHDGGQCWVCWVCWVLAMCVPGCRDLRRELYHGVRGCRATVLRCCSGRVLQRSDSTVIWCGVVWCVAVCVAVLCIGLLLFVCGALSTARGITGRIMRKRKKMERVFFFKNFELSPVIHCWVRLLFTNKFEKRTKKFRWCYLFLFFLFFLSFLSFLPFSLPFLPSFPSFPSFPDLSCFLSFSSSSFLPFQGMLRCPIVQLPISFEKKKSKAKQSKTIKPQCLHSSFVNKRMENGFFVINQI